MIASVGSGVAQGMAKTAAAEIVMNAIFGNFNPTYNKESRRRMRYIQQKYALAYGPPGAAADAGTIIKDIDPNSKLLMTSNGAKPANPFSDESSFEDSLKMSFHPVSGHEGKFAASHAMTSIGVINDYQIQRRQRPWVPGIIGPGKPNDFINMFCEESKTWFRTQMTLDSVHAEELARRDNYYTKLKNDNYYWCFPPEGQNVNIHKVIDFIHDKVKNALSVVSREEKNKSLQTLFKELNDHTANAFEFGKYFLAYLVSPSQKAGSNIVASKLFNGNTFETGRLTRLLEQTTNIVFETYVEDMDQTIKRLERKSNQALLATNHMMAIDNGAVGDKSVVIPNVLSAGYIIEITDYEESSYAIGTVLYVMEVCDPKAYRWVVKKAFSDFDRLHKAVIKDLPSALVEFLGLPAKAKKLINKKDDYERLSEELSQYLLRVLATIVQMNTASREVLATFLEVKHLILPDSQALRHAEHVPNVFVSLKEEFNAMLMGKNVRSNSVGSQSERKQVDSPNEKNSNQSKATKQMMEFRKTWGIEWAVKIFDAYAYLQRIATILGWTLEINHFFVSMFGNTLSFSKLPLREILITLKDIMANFLVVCEDLYKYACQLHAEAQYKWHKNLETTERNLSRIKHHVDKALATISLVECEHLDLEAQMRRLQDVHARFMPLMSRIDDNLGSIQHELGLPSTATNSLSQALEMERSNYQQLEGPRSAVPSYPPRIPKNITGSPETHAFVAFNSDYKQTVRIEEVDSDDGGKTGDYNDRCSGSNEEILKLGDEMNAAPKVLNRIRSSGNESRVLQGIAAANFKDSVLEHVENDSYHVPPVKDQVVGDSLVCTIC